MVVYIKKIFAIFLFEEKRSFFFFYFTLDAISIKKSGEGYIQVCLDFLGVVSKILAVPNE